jgi:uncharacterized membrane protein YfcA
VQSNQPAPSLFFIFEIKLMTLIFIVILAGAFITGLSKGGLGGALGAIVTPLLALVLPAQVALGLALPLLISGDICALYAHWRGWDKDIVWAILPASIVRVVIGTLVITSVSSTALQHALGVVAVLYTGYKLWERWSGKIRAQKLPRWQVHILGSLSGFASAIANAGSPIFTIYLLTLRVVPSVFVGTSVLYFALLNAMKIPTYLSAHILTPESIAAVAWAMPLVPFGVWTGIILDRHIDMRTFENIILVLLALTGIILLLK